MHPCFFTKQNKPYLSAHFINLLDLVCAAVLKLLTTHRPLHSYDLTAFSAATNNK